jgi:undecaprenyl diphosphate synthase
MTEKESKIPVSIGIIMDGNRRWAKKNSLSVYSGHKKGYEKFREVLGWCKECGIKNVFIYAFSSENWHRNENEVSGMMKLLRFIIKDELESLIKEKVKINVLGNIKKFPEDLQKSIKKLEYETKEFNEYKLGLCLSYGGREEILNAINKITKEGKKEVNEEEFSKYLWSDGMVDPDLILRTSGEKRLSGFLPWQSVYSELFFTLTLWPDFSKEEFKEILEEYSKRERRNGK